MSTRNREERRYYSWRKTEMVRRKKGCEICNELNLTKLTWHHIEPYCNGGQYDETNMVMMCEACHNMWHLYESSIPQRLLWGDTKEWFDDWLQTVKGNNWTAKLISDTRRKFRSKKKKKSK